MDIYKDELLGLLKALYHNHVKYILIGGFATNLHGYTRTTADIDIWIKDDINNRKLLRKALHDIGIGDFEAIETMDLIPGWTSIYLDSGFELDIMTYISGFNKENFEDCYKLSVEAIIADIPVHFLHINHLIKSKKIANRPKDLLDVIELEKILQLQNGA